MEANREDLLKAEIYIQRLHAVLVKLFDSWSFARIWLWLTFLTFLSLTVSFAKSNGMAMPSFLLSSYSRWARSKADAKCHSTFQQERWAGFSLPCSSGGFSLMQSQWQLCATLSKKSIFAVSYFSYHYKACRAMPKRKILFWCVYHLSFVWKLLLVSQSGRQGFHQSFHRCHDGLNFACETCCVYKKPRIALMFFVLFRRGDKGEKNPYLFMHWANIIEHH